MDVFDKADMHEAAVYFEHGLDPNTALMPEAGVEGALKIVGVRSLATLKATGALACRWTGVDALYRIATDREFPE
jgi:hypothetical protein